MMPVKPACPWCCREFDEWHVARRHTKFCVAAPRPRGYVETSRALQQLLNEIRDLALQASPEEIEALRNLAERAEEQRLSVAAFLREIVSNAGHAIRGGAR
jgi:hypothetical protein